MSTAYKILGHLGILGIGLEGTGTNLQPWLIRGVVSNADACVSLIDIRRHEPALLAVFSPGNTRNTNMANL